MIFPTPDGPETIAEEDGKLLDVAIASSGGKSASVDSYMGALQRGPGWPT